MSAGGWKRSLEVEGRRGKHGRADTSIFITKSMYDRIIIINEVVEKDTVLFFS